MGVPLVIYHANCLDGYGAAYAAIAFFGNNGCELYAGKHGDQPPNVVGRDIYLVDFSYKRKPLTELATQAKTVTVIDHHISAQEDLAQLDKELSNVTLIFDMQESGATLTWRYFFPDREVPALLQDIKDRDIWQFVIDGSADVTTAMVSYQFNLTQWQQWFANTDSRENLRQEGAIINRFRANMVDRYKRRVIMGHIAGYYVPIVNAPSEITSELLGELAEKYPFAAGFQDMTDRRGWSLRSRGNGGVNVAEIASKFGGGGHKNAAGFSTPLPTEQLNLQP